MLIPSWLIPLAPLVGSAIALLTAVLAFRTSRRANSLAERTAAQQDRRGRSEETMRLLRWAVELATEGDTRRSRAGVATLDALVDAKLVVRADRTFVEAVAGAVSLDLNDEAVYSEDEIYGFDTGAEEVDDA